MKSTETSHVTSHGKVDFQMAFIPFPNTAKVLVRWTSGNNLWTNVLHFVKQDFSLADMTQLATDLGTGFFQELKEPFSDSVSILGVTIYDMRAEDAPRIIHNYGSAIAGGQAAEPPVALNATAVISLYGAGRGKSQRGRLYFSGIPEADADEERVQAGQYEVLRAAVATLITAPPTGWTFVIASSQANGVPRTTGLTVQVVSVVGRDGKWATQSRRSKRS